MIYLPDGREFRTGTGTACLEVWATAHGSAHVSVRLSWPRRACTKVRHWRWGDLALTVAGGTLVKLLADLLRLPHWR